jgi:ADP-heptose:LPS heptosyltransferase
MNNDDPGPSKKTGGLAIHNGMRPDRLLVLHHGALGDLLCAWPALSALAGAFADARRYALVRDAHHFLVRPLGYLPCPDELRGAEGAFHDETRTDDKTVLFRFCLDKLPAHIPKGAHCLAALSEEPAPVAHTLLARLHTLGLPVPGMEECLALFRELFGGWKGTGRLVGIFPGSGHRAKNWPPERFAEIARALAHDGYQPVQILGHVEREQNIRLPGVPDYCPQDVAELTDILANTRLVFGNDSGPLHLAAWLGVPCAALFGPSDSRRWGPPGARILPSPLPCAPCTKDMRRLGCAKPECMDALGTDQVLHELRRLLLVKVGL